MSPGDVQAELAVEVEDRMLRLTLDRPAQYNALTPTLVRDLTEQLRAATTRDDVRVVLLTGRGAAFCAGADLGGPDAQEKYDAGPSTRPTTWSEPSSGWTSRSSAGSTAWPPGWGCCWRWPATSWWPGSRRR